ncbi:phospholipase/Carboxylesterase [Cordyceps javanica]|uniref:Phospholipase/Carboxylesterase n=1 Tax=Cordyceps javanica TaxID=43265 RepID=A0A545V4T9_9HYPO|nr:phospholipase/Carboxylesterase [Cordyceps javanica]TQW08005.1 phospholipase/Carboxylesterase [Cordyceps javanica]
MQHNAHVHGPAQGQAHTCTVIFLHGRDSGAREFADELFESEASSGLAAAHTEQDRTLRGLLPTVRWVFPAAAMLHSQRFDAELCQWFDMWSVEDPEAESEIQRSGLQDSIKRVLALLETEEKLVPRNRIFLCGISQGFATALSLLFCDGRGGFAGLIGLCSWLPFSSVAEATIEGHKSETSLFSTLQDLYCFGQDVAVARPLPDRMLTTPVFLGHALDDAVVPVANGRRMKNVLSALGLDVEWHEYADGGHWVNEPQGVDDMLVFIKANCKQVA